MKLSSRARSRTSPTGATLIELVAVLAIIAIVGGALGTTLVRQQQYYRGAADRLSARERVRDALELLSADIRGMSVADTARLLTDSAFEFFATFGGSVICGITSPTEVGLPPAIPPPGNTLTGFLFQPDTGDLAIVYRDSAEDGSRWEQHRISGFGSGPVAASCPDAPGLAALSGGDPSRDGFLLTLASPLSTRVRRGAPVRFVRRGRYSLYRSSTGEWYLGYRRCNAVGPPVCAAIQPLSGPYRAYSSDAGETGLLFSYFDSRGAPTASAPLALARVNVTARAADKRRGIALGAGSTSVDSGTVSIAIRNRFR